MHFTSISALGVPIKLLKNEQIVAEVREDPDWTYDDVTDHYAVAVKFVDYIVSIREQLLATKGRRRKGTVTEDWDHLIITYKDGQTVRYHKDELIVPTPIAISA
jgi:hypothetical protein